MIYVETEPYCQDCPEFDPEAEHGETIAYINEKPLKLFGNTTVRCKHRVKCRRIRTYLEQYIKSEKENT